MTNDSNYIVYFKTSEPDFGVPKYRTCLPKKKTRKFGFPKLFMYNEGIVTCKTCGDQHTVDTVCGTCYTVLKAETDKIKEEKLGLRKME
ncbi:unnamed protein product [Bursaphelenchus xylophilus]|uniref:(pine wood nematode) hypothetical protein n=1 Tax=Bursaphelenchus xylophilus TaxID=6326 RepID=A0A1I7ST08_BURXY|nr:unnamed protein product [Bursaphelenchus xylophilus]CAG9108811.1 unnamed protein product [Bursaphelenchus xylophilus]